MSLPRWLAELFPHKLAKVPFVKRRKSKSAKPVRPVLQVETLETRQMLTTLTVALLIACCQMKKNAPNT